VRQISAQASMSRVCRGSTCLPPRRLRRVARACLDFGQRVQLSVFECPVEPAQWAALKNRLIKEINRNPPVKAALR
jgi:CRISPR-associated endonuclease Cas2